jgi:hypothetical protein
MKRNGTDKVEEALLSLFRVAMLAFMILALLCAVVFGAITAHQAMQRPLAVAPAKPADEKDITLDSLKKALKDANQKPAPGKPDALLPNALKYQEEATRLFRCSIDLAQKTAAQITDDSTAASVQRVEELRAYLERTASAETFRGDRWVTSVAGFVCAALADDEIIRWVRDDHYRVFAPTLAFHLQQWDDLARREIERHEREVLAEKLRVQEAQARTQLFMMLTAISFGAFMVLAFYLLFSKIERNLREHADLNAG